MEQLQELINQLKEQFEQKAPPSQMLQTARLLEAELARLSTQAVLSKVSANVAVMMPSSMKIYTGQAAMKEVVEKEKEVMEKEKEVVDKEDKEATVPAAIPVAAELKAAAADKVNGAPAGKNGSGQKSIVEFVPDPIPAAAPRAVAKEQVVGPWPFDPLAEIPTLAQQLPRELNDVIGNNGSSLNDKLKSNVLELRSALNDTPVRDLKKAIGVNDRFVFISQLFRGDEVMYERSLKTINGFRILPEAEYWMERELKVKLGWDENRDATKHFYQLVKRRFS